MKHVVMFAVEEGAVQYGVVVADIRAAERLRDQLDVLRPDYDGPGTFPIIDEETAIAMIRRQNERDQNAAGVAAQEDER